jgi:hypothetical protein
MHYTIFDTPILRDLMRALSISAVAPAWLAH